MKIHDLKITPFSIPFKFPIKTASKTFTVREGIWVQFYSEDLVGIGEASPLIHFSNESIKDVYYAIEGFNHAVNNEELDDEEFKLLIHAHAEDVPSAKFALETAFYDILSRKHNKSIAQYINSNYKSSILINGIVGIHSSLDGYQIMKVKAGFRNLFDEIENMENIAQSFGSNVKFRIDLNGALDLPRAIRFCKEMEKFNVDYIEQPIMKDNLEDLSELRYHTEIPIALDESLTDFISAESIIEMQAADIFIIKPMISGGFHESGKIINLAISENIRTIITSSLESIIGQAACLHLASAHEISEACGLANDYLLNKDNASLTINAGVANIPNKNGLGFKLPL